MRDLRQEVNAATAELADPRERSSDRSRRIRDAVEAALSDIILLGTEEQVRLAARAASELAAGRPVHTSELVASLRDFIRDVLDLDPITPRISIPLQGPARSVGAKGGDKGDDGGKKGRGGDGGGGGGGFGLGVGRGLSAEQDTEHAHPGEAE
jgi:hypothetical protein